MRQNLRYLQQPGIEYVLILSGDQLYRMDFREMIATHMKAKADVTISAVPVHSPRRRPAWESCVLTTRAGSSVSWKNRGPKAIWPIVRTDPAWIDAQGNPRQRPRLPGQHGHLPVQSRHAWSTCSPRPTTSDFGKEVFPASIRTRHVQVHLFDGYWEDIGTIKSFFEANLELDHAEPPFDLVSPDAPIYSRARFLPPSRDRRGHDPRQPGGRRLHDRARAR